MRSADEWISWVATRGSDWDRIGPNRFMLRANQIGPAVHPDREVCVARDPWTDAAGRPHRAACHFANGRDAAV